MSNFILKFIFSLTSALLAPLNVLINNFIPSLSNAFASITNFFSYIGDYVPFVMSYTGLTTSTLSILVILFRACISLYIGVYAFKLGIKWYSALH